MQDRVPLYPGRVKLVPVAGQENTYDMVRADSPTQEGTPLNKDSLLKDATAALFGLGADAVPDDVLAFLSKAALLNGDGVVTDFNGDIKSVQIANGSYVGTGTLSVEIVTGFKPLMFAVSIEFTSKMGGIVWIKDNLYGWTGSSYFATLTWLDDGIAWTGQNSDYSFNKSGATYHYIAIG